MNRLVDEAQAAKDAAILASESEACNYDGVTLQASNGACGAPRGHSVAPSGTPARVCTCQVTDDNRIERDECPRHGDTGGLLRDMAWDAISGGTQNPMEKR